MIDGILEGEELPDLLSRIPHVAPSRSLVLRGVGCRIDRHCSVKGMSDASGSRKREGSQGGEKLER